MAAEIAKQRPDFVALHEAWKLTVGGVIKMDLLQSVIDELKALGQPYELARNASGSSGGTVNDEDIDFTPLGLNIQLTDRDAILKRTDVDILTIGVQPQQFAAPITIILSTGLPPPRNQITITLHGGYVSVDAIVRGLPLRFVSVHLIPNPGTILVHTAELLAANSTSSLPLVFGGDFNTTADDPSDPSYLIYQALTDPKKGGYLTDAWNPQRPGPTCCQDADLRNVRSKLNHRIDLILLRGPLAVENINLIGNKPSDRTLSGLWPSDHAGVVATLGGPDSQQVIADK